MRTDVVAAILAAYSTYDVGSVDMATLDATDLEKQRAMQLFIAQETAAGDHRDREVEVWGVLLAGRTFSTPPTWEELFEGLDDSTRERLEHLYPAMPASLQAQFDRRFGRPQL